MAPSDRWNEPVSEEEFEAMPERISQHFDRVRELMEQEIQEAGESE